LVSEHREDTFNFTNPASLVFPEENHLTKFDRIALSDEHNFQKFINYEPPAWKLSNLQYRANAVSLITACGMTGTLLYYLFPALLRHRNGHRESDA
jgi:hypothetical protein